MNTSKMRLWLTLFSEQNKSAEELANEFPNCECEHADSPDGSKGPVKNEERLRHFLTSPSHRQVKRNTDLEKNIESYFKAKHLIRVFDKGLSVYRIDCADKCEIFRSAKNLFEIQKKSMSKINRVEIGGVIGFVDFDAELFRNPTTGITRFCVYETPLVKISANEYRFPSHADIVCEEEISCDEEKTNRINLFYNYAIDKMDITVGKVGDEYEYRELLPEAVRQT